jgi:hypothetical protein
VDKCNTCHNPYRPDCDWNQGRCPNHPPLIKITKIINWFRKKENNGKRTVG